VNSELLIETVKTLNQEKIDTTELLVTYFKRSGYNPFKAAEFAEKNVSVFIDFLNEEITRSYKQGEVCLYLPASNRNVTCVNPDYFFVERLLHELLNGITDREFEFVCASVLKHSISVENAIATKGKGDGGYDFYGRYLLRGGADQFTHATIEIFGQSKQYSGNISRPEIDKFLGFIQNNSRNQKFKPAIYIFATTSDFSPEAKTLADDFGIICWTGMQIASFIFNSLSSKFSTAKDAVATYINS